MASQITSLVIVYSTVCNENVSIGWRHHASGWTRGELVLKRISTAMESLQWRHNGPDGVSNHQPHSCLLIRLFGRRSKKTPKLGVTGLCGGNSPGTGEFPAQMASNAENVSIWWRHHWWCHVASSFNVNLNYITHWGRGRMVAILQPYFQINFLPRRILWFKSPWNFFHSSN